jgi:Integral membrane protein EMC3/TMCO1-like
MAFDLWPNAHEDLVLDDQIRNWVLIPITGIMILISVLRHFIMKYFASTPTVTRDQIAEQ